jgi:predicted nucleic acid-binding protein
VTNAPALLDTSALLALLLDEPGADEVEQRMEAAEAGGGELFASFASLAEVYYITHRKHGAQRAAEFTTVIRGWPLTFVYADEPLTLSAGELKANHTMSFADAFVAATALHLDAELVHKDPEYESLAGIMKLAPLPYKPRKAR